MNLFKTSNPRSAAPRAFTIIEIALCLGIIGFALVAIIAALPRGLDVQKRNREETIIGHDADVWMSYFRSGSRGSDELTNYVLCITNFWTTYDANSKVIKSDVDWYTPTNSNRTSGLNPANNDCPLNSGARIVGLLSMPKIGLLDPPGLLPPFIPPATENYQSNYMICYARSFSGSAVDKVPQSNPVILGDSFVYRMIVENFPNAPVDTNGICMDCVFTNGLSKTELQERADELKRQELMQANTHDFRLRFRWPVLPNGRVLDYATTFRSIVDGTMSVTNDDQQPLYFVLASTFTNSVANQPPP